MAYENRRMDVKVPGIIALILPPIFVIARLWIRLAITKLFGIDDWMILASMVWSPSKPKILKFAIICREDLVASRKTQLMIPDILCCNVCGASHWLELPKRNIAVGTCSQFESDPLRIWNAREGYSARQSCFGTEGSDLFPKACSGWLAMTD
ncbi:hypothetical protein MMC07_002559 [Pseudocyphellaria aurata]|nr:hypothetical protein [Pseudocyphellaria aurata]